LVDALTISMVRGACAEPCPARKTFPPEPAHADRYNLARRRSAHMGYCHYWEIEQEIGQESFSRIVADVQRVAVPADYRVTGVKTFMVDYDRTVYQKERFPQHRQEHGTLQSGQDVATHI
jgi:hypothetical protein